MSYDLREKFIMTFLLFALGCGFGFLLGFIVHAILASATGEVSSLPVFMISGLAGGVSTTAIFWRNIVID